jgi:hypothetical protein
MEDYIGKTCPFCKTTINEGDEVMVCPSCATPHHKACWDENKGCTTFGCSEQHYVAQGTNPTDVCKNCGAALGDGQNFCPKCGTPKNASDKNLCTKCGAELSEGQEFCSKCGQKVGLAVDTGVSSAIAQFNEIKQKANNKKVIGAIVAVAAAFVLIVGGVVLAPKIFVSVDDLCAQGNYQKAYEKAKDDEKELIKIESIAAERSAYSADNLKDPSSFSLRDVYYNEYKYDGEITPHLVLYISGANSYGANVSSYWLYTYDDEEREWEYFCSLSDLSDEEYSKYDDLDEMLEKAVNNVGRSYIKDAMSSGTKLNKAAVNRINDMFESGTLDEVEPIGVYE